MDRETVPPNFQPNTVNDAASTDPAVTCTPGFFVARRFAFEGTASADQKQLRTRHRRFPLEVPLGYGENSRVSAPLRADLDDASLSSDSSEDVDSTWTVRLDAKNPSEETLRGLDFLP
jgi:hypothetical protein